MAGATAVLVNSAFAERLLTLDQAPGAGMPPVIRLPFAVPAPRPAVELQQPPLLVSLGIVDPIKAPDLLLEALALVRARVSARLALVGPIADDYRAELLGLAARLGVEDAVLVTGPVPDAEYWAAAARHYGLLAAAAARLGWSRRRLLSQNAVVGKGLLDSGAQKPFGFAIGNRDKRVVRLSFSGKRSFEVPLSNIAGFARHPSPLPQSPALPALSAIRRSAA